MSKLITGAVSDNFSSRSTANVVLPGESRDEAVRRFILSSCSEALRHHSDYFEWLNEATARYEALRSTRSLYVDDPGSPWAGASNTGFPLEAIVGEALIPRFNAATTDSEPIFQVKVTEELPPEAEQQLGTKKKMEEDLTDTVQDILMNKVRIREVRDETYRNAVIDGDGFEEVSWVDEWGERARTASVLQNARGEFLMDDSGEPQLFDANLSKDAIPDDPLVPGRKLKKVLVQEKDTKHIYEGPKIQSWRIRQCIWPIGSTTHEVNDLDWFTVQSWNTRSWFKTREGDPLKGGLKNVDQLLARHRTGMPSHLDTSEEIDLVHGIDIPHNKHKILVWRFFGKFDVDGDGIDEEIIALVAPRERMLLGWRITPFIERPFFHYQLFKMPGRFTARGLPHIGKGIRDVIDFKLNQSNNRESIGGNPPVMYESDSGFDPDIHQYGTGAMWGPLSPGSNASGKIKILDTPKSQEALTIDFINFYRSIMQQLTGINDFNVGGAAQGAAPNITTARGQITAVQEANIKFADFIKSYQGVSEREMAFIDREFFREGLVTAENLSIMTPTKIKPALFKLAKQFKATGNSATMNRQAQQEIAMLMFDRFSNDPMFQLDPGVQRKLRQSVLNAFDQNDIDLPPSDQLQKLATQQQVNTFMGLPDEERQKEFVQMLKTAQEQQQSASQVAGAQNGTAGPEQPALPPIQR